MSVPRDRDLIDHIRVGRSRDFLEGRPRVVAAFGRQVAVVRHQGHLHALDDTCPHRGGSLGEGDVAGATLACPLHGWRFELASGCLGGNRSTRVPVYGVVQVGEDVYLTPADPG